MGPDTARQDTQRHDMAYREISSEGLPATPAKIIEFTDRHIEIRISAEAKRHSKPAEMLRRLADGLDADEIGG